MLIGICGTTCAGKTAIVDYLVREHCFKQTCIASQKGQEAATHGQRSDMLYFDGISDLLHLVTKRWRERWIISNIHHEEILDQLQKRPFFTLVSVDAPVNVRWKRLVTLLGQRNLQAPPLDEFVKSDDEMKYSSASGLACLMDRAQVRVINTATTLNHLYDKLAELKLTDERRLRPNWDTYFMHLASLAAQRSNCMKRRVGCVLVRDRRVVSTGYNGTPRYLKNCNEGGCQRCNSASAAATSLSTCLCIHAEENALLEAGRDRIREGATLYCDTCPCLTCSIKISQVGISEVVYSQEYGMDKQTAAVFQEAGIILRQFSPPRTGLFLVCNEPTAKD